MALKKYNPKFLNLAFEKALINLGSTGLNPSVGCVVEKNGAIISSGVTSINGRPHAEFNALQKKLDFKNSNLYVTLEPCAHRGLTAPCTNIIIKKKIYKVFFSILDSDSRSRKKSKKTLNKKKIVVEHDFQKKRGNFFYKSYFLSHSSKLPFIDGKLAISKDYFTKSKNNKWITNSRSLKIVHWLRSTYDCIISTSKSINEDNSLLDCRIEGMENKSPHLAIIDRNLSIKVNLDLFKNIKRRKVIIFTTNNNKKKILDLKKRGVKTILMNSLKNHEDFQKIFYKLKSFNYSRIFVESGLTFLNFLIKNEFIHNIYLFKTNKNLKNLGINCSSPALIKRLVLKNKINVNLDTDTLYKVNLI